MNVCANEGIRKSYTWPFMWTHWLCIKSDFRLKFVVVISILAMGRMMRMVSFRRYQLHGFYWCLVIHTDLFSAHRAASLISLCLVANSIYDSTQTMQDLNMHISLLWPEASRGLIRCVFEKKTKKTKLQWILVQFINRVSQFMTTPQGGRFWFKPEINWQLTDW